MSFQKFPEKSPLSVSYRIIIHVGEDGQQYVTDTVPLMYNRQWVIQIQPQRVRQIPGLSCQCEGSGRSKGDTHATHTTHSFTSHTHPAIHHPDTHIHPASFTSPRHPAIQPPTHTYTQQCICTGFTLHGEKKVRGLSPLKNILPHVSKGEVNTYTISHTKANAEEKGCVEA